MTDTTGEVYYDNMKSKSTDSYSGAWPATNDSSWQESYKLGPIPRGEWAIGQTYQDPNHLGRNVIDLIPLQDNTCWDSGRECHTFKMHGDNRKKDKSASEGCIVTDADRTKIPKGEILIVY